MSMGVLGAAGSIGAFSYFSSTWSAAALHLKDAAITENYASCIGDVRTVHKMTIVAIALFAGVATASLCPAALPLIAKVGIGCIGALLLGALPADQATKSALNAGQRKGGADRTWGTDQETLAELASVPVERRNLVWVRKALEIRPSEGYYTLYQSLDPALKTGPERQNIEEAFWKTAIQQGPADLGCFLRDVSQHSPQMLTGNLAYIVRTIPLHAKDEPFARASNLYAILAPYLQEPMPMDAPLFCSYPEFFYQAHLAGKITWARAENGRNPQEIYLEWLQDGNKRQMCLAAVELGQIRWRDLAYGRQEFYKREEFARAAAGASAKQWKGMKDGNCAQSPFVEEAFSERDNGPEYRDVDAAGQNWATQPPASNRTQVAEYAFYALKLQCGDLEDFVNNPDEPQRHVVSSLLDEIFAITYTNRERGTTFDQILRNACFRLTIKLFGTNRSWVEYEQTKTRNVTYRARGIQWTKPV